MSQILPITTEKTAPTIRELTKQELPKIRPLILELNPKLSDERFEHYFSQINTQAYRCAGVFDQERLIGIAGFWMFTRFWCGKQCDIDNVIITEDYRGQGFAKQLMAFIEGIAKEEGCDTMVLDSYTNAEAAHKFYFKQGYFIKGFHFIKPIE